VADIRQAIVQERDEEEDPKGEEGGEKHGYADSVSSSG
jgi:hypothetical protein